MNCCVEENKSPRLFFSSKQDTFESIVRLQSTLHSNTMLEKGFHSHLPPDDGGIAPSCCVKTAVNFVLFPLGITARPQLTRSRLKGDQKENIPQI